MTLPLLASAGSASIAVKSWAYSVTMGVLIYGSAVIDEIGGIVGDWGPAGLLIMAVLLSHKLIRAAYADALVVARERASESVEEERRLRERLKIFEEENARLRAALTKPYPMSPPEDKLTEEE